MPEMTRQGLFVKHLLTARERAELERLAAMCNAHDHILIQLDDYLLTAPALPTDDLFLFYQDDRLVGCLLLDRHHSNVKEVTGLVDPAARRRGIFQTLLAAAGEECLSRGITRLLCRCETTSRDGLACLRAVKAGREFVEHRMVLETFHPLLRYDDHLFFRRARREDSEDQEKLTVVLAADFGGDRERARQHILRAFEHPNQSIYLASYGGGGLSCGEPVGTLRVEEKAREMEISTLFVRPVYRGRGHGRQMMEEVITTLRATSQKPITLLVDTNNFTALNLYRSLGFVIERTYEYYGLDLRGSA